MSETETHLFFLDIVIGHGWRTTDFVAAILKMGTRPTSQPCLVISSQKPLIFLTQSPLGKKGKIEIHSQPKITASINND